MGEKRTWPKIAIVANRVRNTTATRISPVAARKKPASDATAPAKSGRTKKAAAPAEGTAVTKKRTRRAPAAAPAARNGENKFDLVIIESPGKTKALSKYLGPGYLVLASVGHVRDLPPKGKQKGE